MKVASKFKFQPCFGFYLNLLKEMRAQKAPSYEIIHSAGGRACGKTYCFTLFVALLFYYRIPAIVYAFRKPTNLVVDSVWKEILDRLEDAKITGYRVKKVGFKIDSTTTSVFCMGLYNPSGENVVKKGIASSSRYTYAIKWFEEANEYEEKDIQAIDQAIRGAKYLIKVYTTNPWALHNWYISYLDKKFPFSKAKLLKDGYQWKYFPDPLAA
uniref:Phage terminase large subunit N-terminal domain-containing protein n=1 Tax=Rhizophagus sp. DAOM 213198 TaxID=1417302 RepID=A0A0A7BUZ7_9GLOM|nr:hypothetical protein [Rhizophagus sp. DAOM 213198]